MKKLAPFRVPDHTVRRLDRRNFLTSALALVAISCGCTMTQSDRSNISAKPTLTDTNTASRKIEQLGVERVFTNTQVVMWMPSRAEFWDEHFHGDCFARVTFDTIEVLILIKDSGQGQEQLSALNSDWAYQDHPILSMRDSSTRDGQARKQMRKNIWDPTRKRRLSIDANVLSSEIYAYDVETAKKMIESIKLVESKPDERKP